MVLLLLGQEASCVLGTRKQLGVVEVIPCEVPADATHGHARVALETAGAPIGGNDLLIASQALSLDMIVVTANEAEFNRVRGLKVENWLK